MTDNDFPDLPDFDLRVRAGPDETRVEVLLAHPAAVCWRGFCDADRFADWLMVVGTVVVGQRDAAGRALEVDFLGSLERASIAYTLAYEYDDARREVRWNQKGGSVKRLSGSARFDAEGPRACTMRYVLAAELPRSLPPWADELYRARPAETVVLDFCEWLHQHAADY